MKTASVITSLSRNSGGLFDSVRYLNQSMARIAEVDVTIFGIFDEYTDVDLPEWLPLTVKGFKMLGWKQFAYAPGLKSSLFNTQPDIIHSHGVWEYPSTVVSAYHRKYRRPYVVSPHGMLDVWALKNSAWKKRIAWHFYEGEHLRRSSCIRALNQSEANSIRRLGLKNPIFILPNGIDLPVMTAEPKSTSANPLLPPDRKVMLYLGRLHPKKGLPNLIEAWGKVGGPRNKEWVLAIAGWDQGGHENQLKQQADDQNISWGDSSSPCRSDQSVFFLGPQFGSDKKRIYSRCDAFILPSFSEGLPVVILEAWAHGKPVLMTPECNLPEGFAADAAIRIETNAESIIAGITGLFEMSQQERELMGQNGLALVKDHYNWANIAKGMVSVYEWILGGGPKPNCVVPD